MHVVLSVEEAGLGCRFFTRKVGGYPIERVAELLKVAADQGLELSKRGCFVPDFETEGDAFKPKQMKQLAAMLDKGELKAKILRTRRWIKTGGGGYFKPAFLALVAPSERDKAPAQSKRVASQITL